MFSRNGIGNSNFFIFFSAFHVFVSPAKVDLLGTGLMIEKSKRIGEGRASETAGLRERSG